MEDRPDIKDVIARMRSEDRSIRDVAWEELSTMGRRGIDLADGMTALVEATRPFPPDDTDRDDSRWLILALRAKPHPQYTPLIVDLFPRFTRSAQEAVLELLLRIDDREAAVAYVDLLRSCREWDERPELALLELRRNPRNVDVLFPALFSVAECLDWAPQIYELAFDWIRHGNLSANILVPYGERIVRLYEGVRDLLLPSQEPAGVEWMWEHAYSHDRAIAAMLLDLMGFLPAEMVTAALHEALGYRDPKLLCYAVVSLVRLGETIPDNVIHAVAASDEMRNWLFRGLEEIGRIDLFPATFRTQADFARSKMVDWLSSFLELGRVPDEIELMDVVSRDTGPLHGLLDYYVFRFRTFPPHWAADDGWMAGIAGPFRRADAPTTHTFGRVGGTFSEFEPWESATPAEHEEHIRQMLAGWQDQVFAGKTQGE